MNLLSLVIAAWLVLIPGVSRGVEKRLVAAAGMQQLDEEAPGFTLSFDGGKISLAELRGKVVVLHIWATWCKPCREEFPLFDALYRRFNNAGVVFLPVAIDANVDRGSLASLAKGLGAGFPVYLAKEGEITERYWSWGVPVTYVIDKKGYIAGRAIGPRDWASKEMAVLVEALIME